MKHIYTSVDIGSDSIKVVVCELYQNKINLLAASSTKSNGIKKGLIVDFDKAKECVLKAIQDIEEMLGFKIRQVIASVPVLMADYSLISATIPVSETVSNNDIVKVISRALDANQDIDRETITVLPIDYKVGDKIYAEAPIGVSAKDLLVRAIKATTPRKNVYSVCSLFDSIGIEVVDVALNPIGDLYAFRNKDISTKVGSIINIGSDTITISLYNKGIITKSSIIYQGGKLINNDIKYMYNIDDKKAQQLKKQFALATSKNASSGDMIEFKNNFGEDIKINQYEISEVIGSRIEEMLNLTHNELSGLTSRQIDYIIITGGVSNIPDIDIVANTIFGRNVNIGNIKVLGIRDNKYSSCVGNIVYFINKLKLKGQDFSMVNDEDIEKLVTNGKEVENKTGSMLGKIFGFFFDE